VLLTAGSELREMESNRIPLIRKNYEVECTIAQLKRKSIKLSNMEKQTKKTSSKTSKKKAGGVAHVLA
jgi:hypothetical protein